MRALLSDLDRTLTGPDLALDPRVLPRLRALRREGILVAIVTGRALDHLLDLGLDREVDAVVAENGAVIAVPRVAALEVAGHGFADRARAALGPLAAHFTWGRVLGSGPRKLAEEAGARLVDAGVPHALSFNAEEVMLLPRGVDKASGARRALALLGAEHAETWAIGDGENDLPLLRAAARGGAPANAHDAVMAAASVRLAGAYAEGFLEFTRPLLPDGSP